MITTRHPKRSNGTRHEPAWDVAQLFPSQGDWSEEEYLALAMRTNRLIELADGRLEVLPTPTEEHQLIIWYLMDLLRDFVRPRQLGEVLFAGIPVRLAERQMREPDVLFMLAKHAKRAGNEVWEKPDLVMEVVSKNDPARDLKTGRKEYAAAGIPEYWIVDPRKKRILVLTLPAGSSVYEVAGEYAPADMAACVLLKGFAVDVAATFAAGGVV